MVEVSRWRDIDAGAIATANGVHQALRYAIGGMGTALALAILNGTHEIARYDAIWLMLGIAQISVVPLMLFVYPALARNIDQPEPLPAR